MQIKIQWTHGADMKAGWIIIGLALATTSAYAQGGKGFSSVYTNSASCPALNHTTFAFCESPDGKKALIFSDTGAGVLLFGDRVRGSTAGWNGAGIKNERVVEFPNGDGVIFGPKIQWVKSPSGKTCSAIVRGTVKHGVTYRGAQEIVARKTSALHILANGKYRTAKTNDEAYRIAVGFCN